MEVSNSCILRYTYLLLGHKFYHTKPCLVYNIILLGKCVEAVYERKQPLKALIVLLNAPWTINEALCNDLHLNLDILELPTKNQTYSYVTQCLFFCGVQKYIHQGLPRKKLYNNSFYSDNTTFEIALAPILLLILHLKHLSYKQN